ncbi:hypothetical protein AB6R54_004253 [Vibrio parahaemolyticus]
MTVTTKETRFGFYITGQEDKSKKLPTPEMFKKLWDDKFKKEKKPVLEQKIFEDKSTKYIVLSILEYNKQDNFYMGYVGKFRDSALPTKFNRDTLSDEPFDLGTSDEVMEKSYFLYYPETDILVFHCNHWGPRADDLAYMLFQLNSMTPIHFEAIWKNADVKALLEDGSIVKSGSISLALPRNFELADLDLSNSWSQDVIKMMSSSGMSSLRLDFRSRASTTKNGLSYMSQEVRDGFREILQKFGKNRKLQKKELSVKRAEVVTSNSGSHRQNLLNQELSVKLPVQMSGRYPTVSGMKFALMNAKSNCNSTLAQYELDKR